MGNPAPANSTNQLTSCAAAAMKPGKHRQGHFASPAGFTLLELLVVIAITAVLASLLLPALGKAKGKALSAACQNNLKTMQLASEMYTGDNRGVFPPNRETELNGFIQGIEGSWVLGNAKRDTTDQNLRRGVIWDYINAATVYRCPADRAIVRGHSDLLRFRSYALNEFLNHFVLNGGAGHWVAPFSVPAEHQAQAVANTFAFVCANEGTIEDGEFGFSGGGLNDLDLWGWWRLPGERHTRGANLSFLDGHVEYHRWKFTPKPVRMGPVAPVAFFAVNEQDRADLLWLIERTPYWYWPQRRGPRF
jgi:prepilin-type N-terminal cleavage/methylation domain-containing protein/prepilin-type processing-associated H-X9-DG protein